MVKNSTPEKTEATRKRLNILLKLEIADTLDNGNRTSEVMRQLVISERIVLKFRATAPAASLRVAS